MGLLIIQILKWILRIILFILLLLLVLLFVILVVPIRYEVNGEYKDKKPQADGEVSWLFRVLFITFQYKNDFVYKVKVFGFSVFDTSKQKESDEKPNAEEQTDTNETFAETQECSEDNHEQEGTNSEIEEHNESCSCVEETSHNEETNSVSDAEEETSSTVDSSQNIETENLSSEENGTNQTHNNISEEDRESSEKTEESSVATEESSVTADIFEEELDKSLVEKIKNIFTTIQKTIQKGIAIKELVQHYLELWTKEETQVTFNRCKTKLWRIVKSILPRQWKFQGEIGFSNPCTTGQMMAILGILYPLTENHIAIEPNFEMDIMNINGFAKGRIRIGTLLYYIISFILNKHFFDFVKLISKETSNKKQKNGG